MMGMLPLIGVPRSWLAVRALLVACALLALGLGGARAESIDRQCLVSFAVQDRAFSMRGMSMSCPDIEFIRQGILESLHRLGPDPRAGELGQRVSDLQTARDAAHDERRSRIRRLFGVMVGNVGVMVGLKTCMQTVGAGCLFAALYAIYSKVGVVDATTDLARAAESLSALDADLAAAQQQLEGRVRGFETARTALISDFNELCSQVRQQCL